VRDHRPAIVAFGGQIPRSSPAWTVERRYILHVLEAVGGNKTKAAQVLGLDRKTPLPQARALRLRRVARRPTA